MKRRKATLKRKKVYELIDGERKYQDSLGPNRCETNQTGVTNSVGNYIVLMEDYLSRAKRAFADSPGNVPALDVIRKVTALGVRCMEDHGAPPRMVMTPIS